MAWPLLHIEYRKFSVVWDTFFMGSGWPMFSENTLMLYQQDLQLGPYFVKWQLATAFLHHFVSIGKISQHQHKS